MTNKEQQGFPPRVIVSGGNMHGLIRGQACRVYPIPESQPILTDTVYLSETEATALLAEAVREARAGLDLDLHRLEHYLTMHPGNEPDIVVGSLNILREIIAKAASAEGGKP